MCNTNGLYHAKFAKRTGSEDDAYTSNPSQEIKQWMNDHWYRMISYTPYWDDRVSLYIILNSNVLVFLVWRCLVLF